MKFKTPPKNTRYDQNLVADQPGRMIFFNGFFLALILGLAFRGATSPQKIQAWVSDAAVKIHKNIEVHFDSAEVSLSHNGFPRLAVVIHKVEMKSDLTCWAQPRLFAEEIILPFSLVSMIFERQPFKKILATDVELRLRSAYHPCAVTIQKLGEKSEAKSAPSAGISLVKRRKDMDLADNSAIDRLEIDQLKLQYDPSPENSMEVADFVLQVKSHSPKVISLEAKTHLMEAHGKVLVEYNEAPEQPLKAQFFGNWREGHYSLNADYKFADTSFVTEAELKHIPAAPVISALKNYGWIQGDLDGRKIWVTLKGHSEGLIKEWEKLPLLIHDILVEGDLGEITVGEFKAQQLKPLVFKPVQAQFKNLKIVPFLEFLKQPRSLGFLGELGEFNGRLDLANEHEMRLVGKQTGLEFIFSNQSQRQVQRLSSWDGEVRLKQNRWELSTRKILLDQGNFEGELKIQADRDLKKMVVSMNAEDITLAPAVQKLMTGRDQKASFKSQIQMKLADGRVEQLNGFVKTNELSVDQLKFEKLNSQWNIKNEVLSLQVSAQTLQASQPSKAYTLLSQMTGLSESSFKIKQLSGRFEMSNRHELNWKNLSGTLDGKGYRLSSDGNWDLQGNLDGKILVSGKSSPNRWKLIGHRNEAQVEAAP